MKILNDYVVLGALYRDDTGVEAQVGDQVRLFLDTDAIPTLPESIIGVIQHPIVKTECAASTSYRLEYDETELPEEVEFLRVAYIVDASVTTSYEILEDAYASLKAEVDDEVDSRIAGDITLQEVLDDEEEARIAADAVLQAAIENEAETRLTVDQTLAIRPLEQADAPADYFAGVAQVERLSPTGTIGGGGAGNAIVSITLPDLLTGSPRAWSVPVEDGDDPTAITLAAYTVLNADTDLTDIVTITNGGTYLDFTVKAVGGEIPADDDEFLVTIADSTSTGVDTVNSTNQVVGQATVQATDPEHVGRWCRVGAAAPYDWYQADTLTTWQMRFSGTDPVAYNATQGIYQKLVVSGADGSEIITITDL